MTDETGGDGGRNVRLRKKNIQRLIIIIRNLVILTLVFRNLKHFGNLAI